MDARTPGSLIEETLSSQRAGLSAVFPECGCSGPSTMRRTSASSGTSAGVRGAGWTVAKSPRCAARVADSQPTANLLIHVIVGEVRYGPVLRQPGNRRLQREPVALTIDVEVGRLVSQTAKGVAEGGRSLPRLNTAQLDRAIINTTVGRLLSRSRTEVDGPSDPAASPSTDPGWGSRGQGGAAGRSVRPHRSR